MVNRLGVSLCFAERSSGKKDHLYTSQDKVIEKAAKEVLAAMQTDNVSEAREIFDKYAQRVTSQASMPGSVLTINELIKPLLNLPGIKASQVFNEFTPKLCKVLEIKGSESIIHEDLRAKYLIQQYLDEENYNSLLDYISQNRDRIEDQSILIEAAKKMAQGSENAVSGSSILSARIADFRITDERALIEIAKIAAARDPWMVSHYIQEYGIADQQGLIEIAKITAAQHGWGISKCIKNYGIRDEQAIIEIAKIAAVQDAWKVSQYIQNYKITDQQGLIEIAMIVAAQFGEAVSAYIQGYGIKGEQALIKIAKTAATQDGGAISEHIQKYEIEKEQALIEIAMIAAVQNGEGVSQYIQNYGIKNQQALIDIAKIAAAQSALGTSLEIQNYGIQSEQALIEIAKIAAAQHGLGVSAHIQNYGIKNQQALIDIAKIAAAQSGLGVSKYIQKYGITDQQALMEIIKIAAVQGGDKIFPHLQNYGITDQKTIIKIEQIAAAQRHLQPKLLFDTCFEVAAAKLQAFSFGQQQKLEEIQKNSVKNVTPRVFEEKLRLFLILVTRLKLQGKTSEQLDAVLKMLERIMATRSHPLTLELSHHLIALTHDEECIDIWKNAISDKNRACFLPMLLLSTLKGEKPEVYRDWAQKLSGDRDGERGKARLSAILALVKNRRLPLEKKKELVNWVLKEDSTRKKHDENKQLLKDFQLIEQLLELHQEEEILQVLKNFSGYLKEAFFKQLTEIRKKLMSRLLGTEMTGSALEKLEASFGKFRQPDALLRYATRLAKLHHVETTQCLGSYVQSVLEGSFRDVRYSLEKNPHLKNIAQTYPGAFKKWQLGFKDTLDISYAKEATRFDVCSSLKTRLEDGHLEPLMEKCGFIAQFLKDPSRVEAILAEAQKDSSDLARFQTLFIQIYAKASSSRNEMLLSDFKNLKDMMESIPEAKKTEFYRGDLDFMMSALQPSSAQERIGKYTIEDTDDPCDLLLLGTEVKGSCQAIDGNEDLNRGLLGYLLDGKNRAIVIKDNQGVIQARCVIRLLWDPVSSRPALFQERVYPDASFLPKAWVKALERGCLQKAQDLGVDLLSLDGKEPYQGKVVSLGGPVPFEYVDAAGGLKEGGKFEIKNAKRVELLEEKTEKIEA